MFPYSFAQITRTEMNFHPTLHAFIHTQAHKHTHTEAGIQFFPLGPLLLSPDISQRGFHVGSWNTLTAAFPHSRAMFSFSCLAPTALPMNSCHLVLVPLSCLTKTHRKIILSVCFSQRPTRMEIHAIHPSSPHSSSGLALIRNTSLLPELQCWSSLTYQGTQTLTNDDGRK